jgi:hypothetical protein
MDGAANVGGLPGSAMTRLRVLGHDGQIVKH